MGYVWYSVITKTHSDVGKVVQVQNKPLIKSRHILGHTEQPAVAAL